MIQAATPDEQGKICHEFPSQLSLNDEVDSKLATKRALKELLVQEYEMLSWSDVKFDTLLVTVMDGKTMLSYGKLSCVKNDP